MNSVWKFPLEIVDEQFVVIPSGARLLTVQVQGQQACLWAVVNPELPRESLRIRIHGTGHPITDPERLDYISTFQIHNGGLVFHAFKVLR